MSEGKSRTSEHTDVDALLSEARQLVEEMAKRESIAGDLLALQSYDEYTYRHSVNVAAYAVAVARYMGLSQEEQLQIAQAGVCHDLGKQKIAIEIINKPGRLTTEEYEEVKKHPQYSFDMLAGNDDVPDIVRQAVLYHHENENGTGYPQGKEGGEVSQMTRILHAVDVYDALINRRSYKRPYMPVEAFEYLMGGEGILFDEDVVEAMRKVIPSYPIATELELSTGQVAVVVGHTDDPLRPVIRITGDEDNIDLTDPEYAALMIVSGGATNHGLTGRMEELNRNREAAGEKQVEVILVDDSYMSLQTTSMALAEDGYHLITLQSGLAAINYIKAKGAPDLVIMDIEMPVLNGVDTVAGIREMGYADLPVIFLTANRNRETVLKCIQVHAKDYITKPVRPIYLRERVAIALDASRER
ncbi:MAG: response regulator [Butyrivibrio sp.]|nr:response regulator [Butyrivibrio sp.]